MGYRTSPEMSWLVHTIPGRDDCEDALEYILSGVSGCFEPPMGSGIVSGVDENDNGR